MRNSIGPQSRITLINATLSVKVKKMSVSELKSTEAVIAKTKGGEFKKYMVNPNWESHEITVLAMIKLASSGTKYVSFDVKDYGSDVPVHVTLFEDRTGNRIDTMVSLLLNHAEAPWMIDGERGVGGTTFTVAASVALPLACNEQETSAAMGATKTETETYYNVSVSKYHYPDAEVLHHGTNSRGKNYVALRFTSEDDGIRKDSTSSFGVDAMEDLCLMDGDCGTIVTSVKRRMVDGEVRKASYLQSLSVIKRQTEGAPSASPTIKAAEPTPAAVPDAGNEVDAAALSGLPGGLFATEI